jgi:hypothetical protein
VAIDCLVVVTVAFCADAQTTVAILHAPVDVTPTLLLIQVAAAVVVAKPSATEPQPVSLRLPLKAFQQLRALSFLTSTKLRDKFCQAMALQRSQSSVRTRL